MMPKSLLLLAIVSCLAPSGSGSLGSIAEFLNSGLAAQSSPTVALNVQPPAPEHAERILSALEDLRVSHIRSSWWTWSDARSWSWLPAFRRAGIEVLPLIYPADVAADAVGRSIATRYRALFDAYGSFPYIQLGNEVDGDGHFGLTDGRDPYRQGQRWARQLAVATELIRRFDRDVRIVTGGVAWNREGVQDFVRGMVGVGGFDVLAIHTYGIHVYGEPLSRYQAVRAQGWAGPIWLTEWGVSRAEANFAGAEADGWQEENWRRVLAEDDSRFGYDRLYGFQLTPDLHGWGLLSENWQPRPAYRWLRSWSRSGGG